MIHLIKSLQLLHLHYFTSNKVKGFSLKGFFILPRKTEIRH